MKRLIKSQIEWFTAAALWLRCLFSSRFGSLPAVIEPAILLNIHARNGAERHEKEAIYLLKNHLVRVLYERGYCVAASHAVQEQECWGTWNYDCGPHCPKCGGTGIYRTYELIRFTFVVNGQRFTWHQPAGLVDWPVEFTKDEWGTYETDESKSDRRPFGDDEKGLHTAVYKVWWALFRYGSAPKLPLFNHLRFWHWKSGDFYYPNSEEWFFLGASLGHEWWQDNSVWKLYWPRVPDWRLLRGNWGRGGVECSWWPDWFGIGIKREDGRYRFDVIFSNRSMTNRLDRFRRKLGNLHNRYLCRRHGHNWRPRAAWAGGGRWCERCRKIEKDIQAK